MRHDSVRNAAVNKTAPVDASGLWLGLSLPMAEIVRKGASKREDRAEIGLLRRILGRPRHYMASA